jgi:MFS family permease
VNKQSGAIWAAWLLAAVYYFYQYSLRTAPAVMIPQLSEAFGLSALAVASLVGLFYWGYSPFSLIAGIALDRWGPRAVVPIGAIMAAAGALLFATNNAVVASIGRLLQGAGGVFALIGAAYIVTKHFPASGVATLIGATQMFGMAGGSAGQFVVGPMIANGLIWNKFWIGMGVAGLILGGLLYTFLPRPPANNHKEEGIALAAAAMAAVFKNPQSILCGLISGLLFIPTTIFDMIWGVKYLQEARGLEYGAAVIHSSTIPLGWIIGCPLLGFISDRLGRRKPVIVGGAMVLLACLAWILYGPAEVLPPYTLGVMAGIASGAAMIPYTVIKEANPPEHSGTATGVINFLNFTSSALLGPVFGWIYQAAGGSTQTALEHYQETFESLLYGVGLAIILALVLKETGPVRRPIRSLIPQEAQ